MRWVSAARDLEEEIFRENKRECIGCDEVGRGCFAGPVVAAAVSFDWSNASVIEKLAADVLITDSKKMTHESRAFASREIRKFSRVGIGVVSVKQIDEKNILQASLLAMRRAVMSLRPTDHSIILIDGNQRIPRVTIEQKTIIKGDQKIFSIAAASIIAKVYRDELMMRYHRKYPMYAWDKNKGYGTLAHRTALLTHGLSPIHRKTFCHL